MHSDRLAFQGHNLALNNQLTLSSYCDPTTDGLSTDATVIIPEAMRPSYLTVHKLMVVAGPHADETVVTEDG